MASDADYELAKIRFRRLYEKAKKLKVKDEDIKSISFMENYKEDKLNIVYIALKILGISVLFLLLSVAGLYTAVRLEYLQAKTIAEWSTTFTGIDLKVDNCIYPFSELLLDLIRPPVDCSFCHGVKGFDRVSNLSQREFTEKYAYSGRPVIITDATANWTAKSKFSFEFLRSVYKENSPVLSNDGNKECQFFPYKTHFSGLSDVFKMSSKRKNMKGEPWYIGW